MYIKVKTQAIIVAALLLLWGCGFYAVYVCKGLLVEKTISELKWRNALLAHGIESKITDKVIYWSAFCRNSSLRTKLTKSNTAFRRLNNRIDYMNRIEAEWSNKGTGSYNFNIRSISMNSASKDLIEIQDFFFEQNKYPLYPEIFITNRYGANIAQTNMTTDYIQNDELWWQIASKNGLYIGDFDYDQSSQTTSSDIAIRIEDSRGAFVGVIKIVTNVQEIKTLINKHNTREQTRITLLNKEGKPLYISNNLFSEKQETISYSQLENQDSKQSAYDRPIPAPRFEDEILSLSTKVVGPTYINELGWSLRIETPESVAYEEISKLEMLLLYMALLSVLSIPLALIIIGHWTAENAPEKDLHGENRGQLHNGVEQTNLEFEQPTYHTHTGEILFP